MHNIVASTAMAMAAACGSPAEPELPSLGRMLGLELPGPIPESEPEPEVVVALVWLPAPVVVVGAAPMVDALSLVVSWSI